MRGEPVILVEDGTITRHDLLDAYDAGEYMRFRIEVAFRAMLDGLIPRLTFPC